MVPKVIDKLIDLSHADDLEIKIAAITALGEGAGRIPKVIDRLLELIDNPSNEVKVAAIAALGRIYRRKEVS